MDIQLTLDYLNNSDTWPMNTTAKQ